MKHLSRFERKQLREYAVVNAGGDVSKMVALCIRMCIDQRTMGMSALFVADESQPIKEQA